MRLHPGDLCLGWNGRRPGRRPGLHHLLQLFQLFNIFNARAEHESAFNSRVSVRPPVGSLPASVLSPQVLVVHWGRPGRSSTRWNWARREWGLAILVASGTPRLLDEAPEAGLRVLARPQKCADEHVRRKFVTLCPAQAVPPGLGLAFT